MRKTFIASIIFGTCITSVAGKEVSIYRCPSGKYVNDEDGPPPDECKKISGGVVTVIQGSKLPSPAPKPSTREAKYEACLHDAAIKAPTDAGLKMASEICKNRFDKSK